MGVVYKAMHVELGKLVALKVLPASTMDEINIERFKNEARMASRLDHLNIVATHDAGRAEGVHFLVMTFVDGIDVAKIVQRHGRLSIADGCEVVRQAAVGLQHAFERGLVHRDIKPSNMMLTREGVVKVLDFGVARSFADTVAAERLTATGMLLGTADYLAPEQWDNPHAVDARADIYSLGCTLYHLLAGHPPFFGSRYQSVLTKMRAHLEAPPPSILEEVPGAPAELAAVLDRMLAKDPAERFATPGELVAALQPFAAGADLVALARPAIDDPTNPTKVTPISLAGDTAEPANTLTTDQRRRDTQGKKISRRAAIALGLAGPCLAIAVGVAYWATHRDGEQTPAPKKPAKIEVMIVRDHGDESRKLIGDIAKTIQPVFTDHDLQISMKFNAPAYFYLVAFNPDGTEQLLYPEDPALQVVQYPRDKNAKSMTTAPDKSEELRVPREGKYFTPDIDGLQAFVLIASAEPLPPYAEWRSRKVATPWNKNRSYNSDSRWQFDGEEFMELPQDRLQVRGGPPKEFRDLCNFFRNLPDVQAVRAIAFSVTKK
jgi:serine/threonine protein kinase